MKDIKWHLKQAFPLTYASDYHVDGRHYVSYWKMWLGNTYKHRMFSVENQVSMDDVYGK